MSMSSTPGCLDSTRVQFCTSARKHTPGGRPSHPAASFLIQVSRSVRPQSDRHLAPHADPGPEGLRYRALARSGGQPTGGSLAYKSWCMFMSFRSTGWASRPLREWCTLGRLRLCPQRPSGTWGSAYSPGGQWLRSPCWLPGHSAPIRGQTGSSM